MSKKQARVVLAPLGTSFDKSAAFPHPVGRVMVNKVLKTVYAPPGHRMTGAELSAAKVAVNISVVTQFFTTEAMTADERTEFTSATKWNLKATEKKAFEALTSYWLTCNSGANIEAANTWYLETVAIRATDTTLVSLAQRLSGWLAHKGVPMPSQLDAFYKAYQNGDTNRKAVKSGKKKKSDDSGVAMKPTEISLVIRCAELLKQLSSQMDLVTTDKRVTKAQKDAMTEKLREAMGTLESLTAK